jgi:site-specific recombinase XerD
MPLDASVPAVLPPVDEPPDPADVLGSKAGNTWRAYRADWKQWCQWCASSGAEPLPAAPSAVATYLKWLAARGVKLTTIRRRLAGIAQAHRVAGAAFDRRGRVLAFALEHLARSHGAPPSRKAELRLADVKTMLAAIDRATDRGKREAALLLLGFAGAFRRSEIVALEAPDIEWSRDGILVTLRRSKTDQVGQGQIIAIRYGRHERTCPVRALKDWLQARQAQLKSADGPIFCRIRSDGTAVRLSGQAYAHLLKRLAALIGLDPARVAGHSTRRGCATEADARGADLQAIADQLRHRKLDTTRGYIRRGTAIRDSVSAKLGL